MLGIISSVALISLTFLYFYALLKLDKKIDELCKKELDYLDQILKKMR